MKRLLTLLVALVVLSACSSPPSSTQAPTAEPTPAVTAEPTQEPTTAPTPVALPSYMVLPTPDTNAFRKLDDATQQALLLTSEDLTALYALTPTVIDGLRTTGAIGYPALQDHPQYDVIRLDMLNRLEARIQTLSEFPERGPIVREDARLSLRAYRFLREKPYLIFYKILGGRVYVYRILHEKRYTAVLL